MSSHAFHLIAREADNVVQLSAHKRKEMGFGEHKTVNLFCEQLDFLWVNLMEVYH